MLVAEEDAGILFLKHFRANGGANGVGHFPLGRPDVFEVDELTVRVAAQGIIQKVDVHRAGQGIGHDQRGRGQVIRPDLGIDPAFEVPVAAQDGGDDQIVVVDRLRDLGGEWA